MIIGGSTAQCPQLTKTRWRHSCNGTLPSGQEGKWADLLTLLNVPFLADFRLPRQGGVGQKRSVAAGKILFVLKNHTTSSIDLSGFIFTGLYLATVQISARRENIGIRAIADNAQNKR